MKVFFKRLLAFVVALATVLTTGNLEEFGTITASAASQYGYASAGGKIWGDMYWLKVNDSSTNTDTIYAFCGKRGTTLVHSVYRDGTSIPYSGAKLRILKAAWWFFDSKKDGTVTGIDDRDRYVVGRLMTWAVTNGGATTADGVINYIKANGSSYLTYESKIRSLLTRAFAGELDSKVTLYYYSAGGSTLQPMIQGTVNEIVNVTLTLNKTGTNTGSRANLKGAVYTIYSDAKCTKKVATMPKTNASGVSTKTFTDVLEPDTTYYVKETTAPTGCALSKNSYPVVPKADKTVEITDASGDAVSDEEDYATVEVCKVSSENKKTKLAGAVYTIYEWSASKKAYVKASKKDISTGENTITTNSKGEASTGKLYYTADNKGKWMIKETKAPEGYSLNDTEKKIKITKHHTSVSWTQKDKPLYGKIKVTKTIKEGTKEDASWDLTATYKVYSDASCKKLVTTITTNKKGVGTSKKIQLNGESQDFYIKEVKASSGTSASTTKAEKITVKANETTQVTGISQTIEVPWHVTLKTIKVDKANTDKTLSGAQFTIYEWNGKKYVKHEVLTTGSDGTAKSTTLYYTSKNGGKFKIKETKAPDGYKLSGWEKEITITKENGDGTDENLITYKVENEENTGQISLSKFVQDYENTYLTQDDYDFSGIQYQVYNSSDKVVDTITLNSKGNGTSKSLAEGTYYIKEVASSIPDTMVNTENSGVGKTLRVVVVAGKTTNYSGKSNSSSFVDKDGKSVDFTFLNNPLINLAKTIDISVLKLDSSTNAALDGATFTLYQWNKKTQSWKKVNTYVSGSDKNNPGWAQKNCKLKYTATNEGKFKLVETAVPSGYVNSHYVKEFSFTDATKVDEIYEITSQYKGTYDANTVYNFKDVVSVKVGSKYYYYQALQTSKGALDTSALTGQEYYGDGKSTWKKVLAYNAIQFYAAPLEKGTSSYDDCESTGRWTWRLNLDGEFSDYAVGALSARFEGEWFIGIKQPNPTVSTTAISGEGGAVNKWDMTGSLTSSNADGCLYELTNKKVFSYSADDYSKLMYVATLCNPTALSAKSVSYTWYRGTEKSKNAYSVTRTFTKNLFTQTPTYLPRSVTSNGTLTADCETWQTVLTKNSSLWSTMTDSNGTAYAAPFTSVVTSAATTEPEVSTTSERGFYDSMYEIELDVTNKQSTRYAWNIVVEKKNDSTGKLLTDAEFTIKYTTSDGTEHTTKLTNNGDGTYTVNGSFYMPSNGGLQSSLTFSLYETKTPSGCVTVDATKALTTFKLTPSGSTAEYFYEATNTEATGTISGKKYDATTKKATAQGDATLAGAVYGLYIDPYCTIKVDEATTDADGNFSFTDVPVINDYQYGAYTHYNYYIKETEAPEGYEIDNTVYIANLYNEWYKDQTQSSVSTTITTKLVKIIGTGHTVQSGTIAATDLSDTVSSAPISIYKSAVVLDAEGEEIESNPLANAGFSLYQVSKLKKELDITDDDAVQNFDLSDEDAAKIAITSDGKTEIYTDENGNATTIDIPYGTYILVETDVPSGYMLDAESRRVVTITDAGQTVSFAFTNQLYQASIEITKLDKTPDKESKEIDVTLGTVEGTKFKVYKQTASGEWECLQEEISEYDDETDTEVTVTQDITYEIEAEEAEDGTISYKVCTGLLTEGTYKIVETEAAPGYLMDEDNERIITIGSSANDNKETYASGAEYYAVSYSDAATLTDIKKTDIVSGEEIAGATLYITNEGGEEVARWVTDGTPYRIKALEPGEYTLTEETAPDGYVIANTISFTVKESGEIQTVNMQDYQIPLEVSKRDIVTGEEIAGATLQIYEAINLTYDEDGQIESYERGALYKEWVTTGETTTISGIPVGEYILVETAAPDGYVISNEVQFEVTMPAILEDEDGNETGPQIQQVEMTDDIITVSINKLRSDLSSQLPDAKMQVLDAKTRKAIYEFTTTDESYLIERIPAGNYILHEVEAPDGFLEASDIAFTVEAISETQEVTMEDEPIYVRIKKVDENGTVLGYTTKDVAVDSDSMVAIKVGEGAVLQVIDATGTVMKEWEVNADFEQDGMLIAGLAPGEYTLHEVSAPSGYCTAADIKFTVTKTEEVEEITMIDQSTKVEISKTDMTGTEELPGAKLTVYKKNEDGSLEEVESWVSTNEAHRIEKLAVGDYVLREETAPDGYVKAEDVAFTVLETGKVQSVEMFDDYTKLQVNKVDQYGNTVTGATLAILDADGNEVDRFTTSDTPHVTNKLTIGKTYTVTEVVTPTGYLPAADVSITIADTAKVQTITMIDYTSAKIPTTGGSGALPYVAAGIGVLLGAALYGLLLMKKKAAKKAA